MQRSQEIKTNALLFLLAALFAAGPALAEKPSLAGNEKGGKHEQKHERKKDKGHEHGDNEREVRHPGGNEVRVHVFFGDQHRSVARNYYVMQSRSGHCPPGLAKKHNGCRPPGHAKKWHVGHPLPREVIYHDLPPEIIVQLGVPLPRHRYVRVAGDILLIAIGTGMVVDALEDLNDP